MRIAQVDAKRQIRVIESDGSQTNLTSTDLPMGLGGWMVGADAEPDNYTWPSWSPDGRYIAAFRLPKPGTGSSVVVLEPGSIESAELATFTERLPIYLYWSPDGTWLAALSQRFTGGADRLHLSLMRRDRIGYELPLTDGAPLFFTWMKEARLATYVGNEQTSQVIVSDPAGIRASEVLPGSPGNFCAPVGLDDSLVYVSLGSGGSQVVQARLGSPELTVLDEVNGLVALVRSPSGKRIARAVAPDGDGTPYRQLAILDVSTGERIDLPDMPCLAFHWASEDRLVLAVVNTSRNLVEWHTLSLDGTSQHFADLYPSRDLAFYLRFFEQYTQSHPLVDASGTRALLSGRLQGVDASDESRVWEVPFDGSAPRDLGPGVFGVYAPT